MTQEVSRYSFDHRPRCKCCDKLLAEKVTRPWLIRCGRCKTENYSEDQRVDKLIIVETDDGDGWAARS